MRYNVKYKPPKDRTMITLNDTEVSYLLKRMALDDEGYGVRTIAVLDGPQDLAFEDEETGEPFDPDTITRIYEAARERTYHCYSCGNDKPISEWTRDSHGVNLCAACMEEAEEENAHSDHNHEDYPDRDCTICRREGLA